MAGGGQFVEDNEHNLRLPIKRKRTFRDTAYHHPGFHKRNDPGVSKAGCGWGGGEGTYDMLKKSF